jgi:hypothetical protein
MVGYRSMFAAAVVLALAGSALLRVWVREPRYAGRAEPSPAT